MVYWEISGVSAIYPQVNKSWPTSPTRWVAASFRIRDDNCGARRQQRWADSLDSSVDWDSIRRFVGVDWEGNDIVNAVRQRVSI